MNLLSSFRGRFSISCVLSVNIWNSILSRSFLGSLPNALGVYSVSVLNGEGYTNTGDDLDNTPEFLVNLRIIPTSDFTLGSSVLYENDVSDRFAYITLGRFSGGAFELLGEYLLQNRYDITGNGFMIMPIIKLGELMNVDVDILGRFDWWDRNTDVTDDSHKRIIGGLNWNVVRDTEDKPQAVLQIQMEKTIFESDITDDITQLMIQLQWGFSNTFIR